jgi:tetratricopeptide (TPR) repeat protein
MRAGLDRYRQTGSLLSQTFLLALIAEVAVGRGRLDEAAARIEEGLRAASVTGERYWEAELHRIAGDVARARGGLGYEAGGAAADAEAAYLRAIESARALGARSHELRAALALASLHDESGSGAGETRQRIRSLVEALAPGGDTADLRRARAYLFPTGAAREPEASPTPARSGP